MEIIREYVEREGCYNFYLKEGEQVLKIIFGGNLDLYWILYNFSKTDKNLSLEEMKKIDFGETKYTFTITKENYFLYSLYNRNFIPQISIFILTYICLF